MNQQTQPNCTPVFAGLGIAPRLLDAIERLGFTTPTPIQLQSIPAAIDGKDLIGVAQTGTGKTLAFGVPMLQRLAQVKGKGLVVLPTRELALQVDEAIIAVGRAIGLRTAVLIGGASMHMQTLAIRRNPHLVIATPGRLLDHLEQKTLTLKDVRILVLDEADRMLDMGFAPQLNRILSAVPPPNERQTMLFSATIPDAIMTMARKHMQSPVRIEVARSGTAASNVQQEAYIVAKSEKPRLLERVLSETRGSILVFTRTKHMATRLTRSVKTIGHTAAELHSNRSLSQRREALDGFKNGKYRVLIATDIAARGIDVRGIELVVNYDLPTNTEDYVHRIGRTGRAGLAGRAISFAQTDQHEDLIAIERLIRTTIPVTPLPKLPPDRPRPYEPDHGRPFQRNTSFSGRAPAYGSRNPRKRPPRSGFQRSRR